MTEIKKLDNISKIKHLLSVAKLEGATIKL